MANTIDLDCDVVSTYDLKTSKIEGPIGHIESIEFATSGNALDADNKLKNPESPKDDVEVLGPIERISWSGDASKPIEITGRLSQENIGKLRDAVSSRDGGAHVKVKFKVWLFDYKKEKFNPCFGAESAITFTLTEKVDPDVSWVTSKDVQKPVNFKFYLSLTAFGPQELFWAPHAANKKILQIGTQG